ncbi:MAG: caspase family protein, partial [Campylobacterota bacterium]|nr:caspase family protein [Campylobacterota bacterium]
LTQNPLVDAKEIGDFLENKGFNVTRKKNLSVASFKRELNAFVKSTSGADVILFYFSGHGVEIEKQNYLLPIDNKSFIDDKYELMSKAIELEQIIAKIQSKRAKVNIVMVDACRNNPFLPSKGTKGLVAVPKNKLRDTYLVFAGDQGVAIKDDGLFRKSFIKYANETDDLNKLWRKMRKEFANYDRKGIYADDYALHDFQFTPTTTSAPKPKYENAILIDGLWYKNEPFTKEYKFEEAQAYCSGLGDGWRLPSRAELMKLGNIKLYSYDNYDNWKKWFDANKDKHNSNSKGHKHFIDKRFIENMPEDSWFWTNETKDKDSAWVVLFHFGGGDWRYQSGTYYALCVRGE